MRTPEFGVTGGRFESKTLTSSLDEASYAIGKAVLWLRMLKAGQIPKTWYRPTKTGTKISFAVAQSREEMEKAFETFKTYVQELNEKYGSAIEIGPAQAKEESTC